MDLHIIIPFGHNSCNTFIPIYFEYCLRFDRWSTFHSSNNINDQGGVYLNEKEDLAIWINAAWRAANSEMVSTSYCRGLHLETFFGVHYYYISWYHNGPEIMKIHLVVIQFQISILKTLCSKIFNFQQMCDFAIVVCRESIVERRALMGPVGTTVPRPKAEKHLQILVHSSVSWWVMTRASWISGYDPIP